MDEGITEALGEVIQNMITRRETRDPTIDLTASSGDEAAVTPIQNEAELGRVLNRYRGVARRRTRRTYVAFRSARRLFEEQDDGRINGLEERMFEADTAVAIRMSMATYKPQMKTVSKEVVDRICPVIKARHQKEKCTVCQEHVKRNEDIRILPCKHYMHDECTVGWFTTGNAVCPVCRNKSFDMIKNPIKKRRRLV
jgi:hypothetical protein